VGFTTTDFNRETFVLPKDLEDIASQWDLRFDSSAGPSNQDLLWSTAADETREKVLVVDAFVLEERSVAHPAKVLPESAHVAEAALKVIQIIVWRLALC
jgi:hypothetical protein